MKRSNSDGIILDTVRGRDVRYAIPKMDVAALRAPLSVRATSFATLKDLEGYIRCLQSGKGSTTCYNYGDNGRGAWGDLTAQLKTPMCALPPALIAARWGTSAKGRGKKIMVTLTRLNRTVVCEVRDKGPDGVVDLNPAALEKLGLPSDTELNEPATWHWL